MTRPAGLGAGGAGDVTTLSLSAAWRSSASDHLLSEPWENRYDGWVFGHGGHPARLDRDNVGGNGRLEAACAEVPWGNQHLRGAMQWPPGAELLGDVMLQPRARRTSSGALIKGWRPRLAGCVEVGS